MRLVARDEHQHRLGLGEAGEVVEVAVEAVRVVRCRGCAARSGAVGTIGDAAAHLREQACAAGAEAGDVGHVSIVVVGPGVISVRRVIGRGAAARPVRRGAAACRRRPSAPPWRSPLSAPRVRGARAAAARAAPRARRDAGEQRRPVDADAREGERAAPAHCRRVPPRRARSRRRGWCGGLSTSTRCASRRVGQRASRRRANGVVAVDVAVDHEERRVAEQRQRVRDAAGGLERLALARVGDAHARTRAPSPSAASMLRAEVRVVDHELAEAGARRGARDARR